MSDTVTNPKIKEAWRGRSPVKANAARLKADNVFVFACPHGCGEREVAFVIGKCSHVTCPKCRNRIQRSQARRAYLAAGHTREEAKAFASYRRVTPRAVQILNAMHDGDSIGLNHFSYMFPKHAATLGIRVVQRRDFRPGAKTRMRLWVVGGGRSAATSPGTRVCNGLTITPGLPVPNDPQRPKSYTHPWDRVLAALRVGEFVRIADVVPAMLKRAMADAIRRQEVKIKFSWDPDRKTTVCTRVK